MSKKTENAKIFLSQQAVIYNKGLDKFLIVKEKDLEGDLGNWQFVGGRVTTEFDDLQEELINKIKKDIGEDISLEFEGLLDKREYVHYEEEKCDGLITFELAIYKDGDIKLSKNYEEFKWITIEEAKESKEYNDWLVEAMSLAKQKIALEDSRNNMLRVLAEFDNYKKKSAEQQREFAKFAGERVINAMLPVLDNFHSATSHIPQDQADSPWLTGIMYIQKQMEKVFEDEGVVEIEIKIGDEFNPEIMEAVASDAKDEKDEKDDDGKQKVLKIIQKGYKIKEKIMRPARVEIS